MKKTLGCLSVYGALAALLVAIAVVGWTLLRGPTLFSPGPLTGGTGDAPAIQGYASHAEMESACTLCHRPWRGVDMARCLACHTTVQDEIVAGTGLHGQLDDPQACIACHTDHLGRQANIAQAALNRFPHDQVGFSLARHQHFADGTALTCADCHLAGGYAFDQDTCDACHRSLNAPFVEQHVAAYGAGCLSCHDGRGMPESFRHPAVFPLDGAHADVACDTCHTLGAVTSPAAACAACHEEPAIHRGEFGTQCAACHTADGWTPARLRAHTFPLDHGAEEAGAQDVPCLTCHPDGYAADGSATNGAEPYTCYTCHEHQQAEIEGKHREEGITDIAPCARCHPTGRAEEGESE